MKLELWGGIECTVNRVGAHYLDQSSRNGHSKRIEDLDRFAELGFRTLRYPVLWEKVQSGVRESYDWTWSDERLNRLRELEIRPIIGLLHHGSGPRWTHLLDPDFPRKLADYALAFAQRYPWVDAYTPINEPLTTARFSGLYGHWFPHARDDASFHNILLNEIEGTILSMEAIRSVRPDAQLVQTEDLGKVFSTSLLEYQANFENERRWLSFDLLGGRFSETSALWKFVTGTRGTNLAQIERIFSRPCPPDIFGINYYVTSERFLDENLGAHPPETHGGNYFHQYADVAAVRVRPEGLMGSEALLKETYDRYQAPVALTEVHLGCTREEQLRWLMEAWHAGRRLVDSDIPMRAVTVWALLGAYDWNTLVTRESDVYEPGAFDARSAPPRATSIAHAVRSLHATGGFHHPILKVPGWWKRPERIGGKAAAHGHIENVRPILVLGGKGSVGQALGKICEMRGLPCEMLSRNEANVCRRESVQQALDRYRPWAVINAAGYTRVDEAEWNVHRCFEVNTGGGITVAKVCVQAGVRYAVLSSDLVFDGEKRSAYIEADKTGALSVYGRSKEQGEKQILAHHPDALIVRTSPLFGPWSLSRHVATLLHRGGKMAVPDSEISPTYIPDLITVLLDLLIDEEKGVWHVANDGFLSWREFTLMLCRELEISNPQVEVVSRDDLPAKRPIHSVLRSLRGDIMPSLDNAIARFRRELLPLYALFQSSPLETVLPSLT